MLNTPAAAKVLGVHPDTMKDWRQKTRKLGRLIGPPWTAVGERGIRYDETDLENYKRERTVSA